MPKKKDTTQFMRALIVPTSFNEESRTVDVTFATPTPVLRYSWRNEEYYYEVLDMDGVNLERASKGLPVLNNHNAWGGVGNILARAENIRRDGESYTATLRFPKEGTDDEADKILRKVQEGIISDVSFGYSVNKIERMDKNEDEQYRTYKVRSWTPSEISLVTIPADPRAGVRSADGEQDPDLVAIYEDEQRTLNKQTNNGQIMKREQIIAMLAKRGIAVDANITDEALNAELERALNPEGADPTAVQTAVENERKRTADITAAVRSAKLKPEFAEKLISEGKTIDEARAAIIEEFAKNDPLAGQRNTVIEVGEDRSLELRRNSIEAQLIQRAAPELLRGESNPFDAETMREAGRNQHMRLLDIARESLVRGGVSVEGLDPMAIVGRAFTSSTSDFGVLLEGTNRRILLAAYQAQADTWRGFCATGSVSDFREHKRLRMGTFTDLETVNENGEYKNKKITDADYEKVSIDTKGNIINVTRKMIINDDLMAFTRLAQMLGRSAARSIENDVYTFLLSNPKLVDGKALFHADHNNTVTSAAPTVAVIDGMRQKMAVQKDKDANDFLDIRPALALAPLSLGSTLRVLNAAQYEPTADMFQKPNVVNGLFRDVIDTPRLTGTAYYMFADPNEEPVIEVNFLNGVQTPYMESEEGFTVDGTKWKIRMDYGVDVVGYRGVVKNAGA